MPHDSSTAENFSSQENYYPPFQPTLTDISEESHISTTYHSGSQSATHGSGFIKERLPLRRFKNAISKIQLINKVTAALNSIAEVDRDSLFESRNELYTMSEEQVDAEMLRHNSSMSESEMMTMKNASPQSGSRSESGAQQQGTLENYGYHYRSEADQNDVPDNHQSSAEHVDTASQDGSDAGSEGGKLSSDILTLNTGTKNLPDSRQKMTKSFQDAKKISLTLTEEDQCEERLLDDEDLDRMERVSGTIKEFGPTSSVTIVPPKRLLTRTDASGKLGIPALGLNPMIVPLPKRADTQSDLIRDFVPEDVLPPDDYSDKSSVDSFDLEDKTPPTRSMSKSSSGRTSHMRPASARVQSGTSLRSRPQSSRPGSRRNALEVERSVQDLPTTSIASPILEITDSSGTDRLPDMTSSSETDWPIPPQHQPQKRHEKRPLRRTPSVSIKNQTVLTRPQPVGSSQLEVRQRIRGSVTLPSNQPMFDSQKMYEKSVRRMSIISAARRRSVSEPRRKTSTSTVSEDLKPLLPAHIIKTFNLSKVSLISIAKAGVVFP